MSTPAIPPANPSDVQGDILSGFPKKTETYVFFQISDDVAAFRTQLAQLVPLVTSTANIQNDRDAIAKHKQQNRAGLVPLSGLNIAFSQTGLTKLGITDSLGDDAFTGGQFKDAQNLGDQGTTTPQGFVPNWVPAFKNPVHGVLFVSGDCHESAQRKLREVEHILKVGSHDATIHEVLRIVGDVRPGKESGHEHFGFLDGISNPAVANFDTKPNPGQETVPQGIILLGRDQDPNLAKRPSWALDGSFLVFRYLFQLVPEFEEFLNKNPIPGPPPKEGSELLGARLVGRWKSGAPVDLAPTADDPALGADPLRNNNFRYDFPDDFATQDRCPFAAHTRKTNPRNDLEQPFGPNATTTRRIIRRGIQFGPEVTTPEHLIHKSLHGRGLLFVCYQSVIGNGFQFIQHSWANAPTFPPQKPETPGFDPIIGQAADPASRTLSGTNPNAQTANLALPAEWVVPRGGEYFFSPSIPALKSKFAL